MPAVEERLTLLEVKMEQVGATLVRMETILLGLDQRMQSHDQRFAALDQKVTGLGEKFDKLDRRIDESDSRFDRLFLWVIGIQVTTLIALIAGLFGIVARLI